MKPALENSAPVPIESLVNARYLPLSRESGAMFALKNGETIVVLPGFLIEKGIELFRQEAFELFQQYGTRRNLELGGTPRKMLTVNGKNLQNGTLIARLLQSPALLEFTRGITGAELQIYGDTNEACVLLGLMEPGDRHGGHLDEFRGVFNIAIASPGDTDTGGVLKFIPGNRDFASINSEQCREVRLQAGDAYMMDRTDQTAHEVTPITKETSTRIIASVGLSESDNVLLPSRSSHQLFSDPR